MNRGDIYTAATGGGYGGKPRPVLIVQADRYSTDSKKIVALIASPVEGALPVRVEVAPNDTNKLKSVSHVMVDVIYTIRHDQFGYRIGRMDDADMRRIDSALLLVMGIGTAE